LGCPAGFSIAVSVVDSSRPESEKDLSLVVLAGMLGGALLAAILLRSRVRTSTVRRNRILANIGVLAACTWILLAAVCAAAILYALAHIRY
jgi:hypothetical protein